MQVTYMLETCVKDNLESLENFCYINIHAEMTKRGHGGAVVRHLPPTGEVSGSKLGPMVSRLQYITLTNCMY